MKTWMRLKTVLILLSMGLCGCASFYANRYPNDNYAATTPDRVGLFYNYPPVPYEVIGEVGGQGASVSDWQSMGERLKEDAAQMGGDAVVITEQARPYVGSYTTPEEVNTVSQVHHTKHGKYVETETVVQPATITPMYGKSLKAFVIKYTNKQEQSQE